MYNIVYYMYYTRLACAKRDQFSFKFVEQSLKDKKYRSPVTRSVKEGSIIASIVAGHPHAFGCMS